MVRWVSDWINEWVDVSVGRWSLFLATVAPQMTTLALSLWVPYAGAKAEENSSVFQVTSCPIPGSLKLSEPPLPKWGSGGLRGLPGSGTAGKALSGFRASYLVKPELTIYQVLFLTFGCRQRQS